MPFLLNIDTATENAIISISEGNNVLHHRIGLQQKDHAAFLQPAIKELLLQTGIKISELNAVAVSAGPGSYTGLRVGMASAKGLCFALNIPLITVPTLKIIALGIVKKINNKNAFYCPAIDARRMEIFTAVYDHKLNDVIKPVSMIVDEESFKNIEQDIYISGSGAKKASDVSGKKNLFFIEYQPDPTPMAELTWQSFSKNEFADVAYSAPFYLKEFYTFSQAEKTK